MADILIFLEIHHHTKGTEMLETKMLQRSVEDDQTLQRLVMGPVNGLRFSGENLF